MFEEVLPDDTKKILALLSKSKIIEDSYLAGGTALALQLGHRISYDLDFFTKKAFDENVLLPQLDKIPNFKLEKISWRTIMGRIKRIKFSIFYYKYPLLYPPRKFDRINLLNPRDLAAMKIAAIASRGVKRDFVDLYFICSEVMPLDEAIKFYDRKYKNLATTYSHILKSLVYFADADKREMPHMLKEANWSKIKKYFEREVRKIALKERG